MYSTPREFQQLVEQVLSRDIRSLRQRTNPKSSSATTDEESSQGNGADFTQTLTQDDESIEWNPSRSEAIESKTQSHFQTNEDEQFSNSALVLYKLALEACLITYTVDNGHVLVHGIEIAGSRSSRVRDCNQITWVKVSESNQTSS